MGNVSGILGTAGGMNGTGYSGPGSATVVNPTTGTQALDQYNTAQDAYKQQQALLTALQAQNGLQNQSNVYGQLSNVANGTGPNPAQAQLAQATAANTANQAALMAGQRGASQNVGLMARQAAMQGGMNQQNSAGQAASMQAQQSLNALQNMGNMATTQAGQQISATNALNQSAQNEQNNLLNSIAAENNANVGMQSNLNNANMAGIQSTSQQQQAVAGGGMQGAGSMMSMMASGGVVDSAQVTNTARPPSASQSNPQSPQSSFGQFLKSAGGGSAPGGAPSSNPYAAGFTALGQGIAHLINGSSDSSSDPQADYAAANAALGSGGDREIEMPSSNDTGEVMAAKGGKVPALLSPGEVYLSPRKAKEVANQGKDPIKEGKKVPGKPKYPGNDYRNDTHKATLQEGGLVIPNKILQGPNAHWESLKFVRNHIKSNKK